MQAETKKTSDRRSGFQSDEDLFNPRQRRAAGVLFFSFPQRTPKNKKPDFLEAEDRQLDQALHEKQDAVEIVVFYPQEPQTIQSAAKKQAEQLMTTLTAEYAQPVELPAARQEDPGSPINQSGLSYRSLSTEHRVGCLPDSEKSWRSYRGRTLGLSS